MLGSGPGSYDRSRISLRAQKAFAAFMSLVLAVSLCPMPSYADETDGGSSTLDAAAGGEFDQGASADESQTLAEGYASGEEAVSSQDASESETNEASEAVSAEDDLLLIGSPDDAYRSLEVENGTDYPVDSIEVKASASSEWYVLPIENNAQWANGSRASVNLPDLRTTVDTELLASIGDDSLYDLKLHIGESSYELHSLDFEGFASASLRWNPENSLFYVDFVREDGTVASTFDSELARVESERAAAEAAAQEEADAQAQAEAAAQAEADAAAQAEADAAAQAEAEAQAQAENSDEADESDEAATQDEEESDKDKNAEKDKDKDEGDEEDDDDSVLSVQDAERITGIDSSKEGIEYVEGEVLIYLENGTPESEVSDLLDASPVTQTSSVEEADLVTAAVAGDGIVSDTALEPSLLVKVDSDVTVVQAVAELTQESTVVDATPNYIYHTCEDEGLSGEGFVDAGDEAEDAGPNEGNLGAEGGRAYDSSYEEYNAAAENSVGLDSAWEMQKSNHSVAVAVIDTGCNIAHEDIDGEVVGVYNSVDRSSDVTDNYGHGSHVAGIVGASAGNGLGIAGVSYNADLVIVKASYVGSSGYDADFKTSTLLSALNWVIANKDSFSSPIRVVNLSLGALGTSETLMGDRLCQAIDAAREAGILVVAAAGNASSSATVPNTCYPSDYDGCLSVINLTGSSFSSRNTASNYNQSGVTSGTVNSTKDISAPGTGIMSVNSAGGYKKMTGTSMATPVVSGVAALCFAADPALSPDEVTSILEGTATDLGSAGWDRETGYGRVNAEAALERVLDSQVVDVVPPDPDPDPDPDNGGENVGEGSNELTVVASDPAAKTGLVWNGEEQQGVKFDAEKCDATGYSATDIGEYTAVVSLKEGYTWSDGSTDEKRVSWSISPKGTVAKPSPTTSFAYNSLTRRALSAGDHYFVANSESADWDDREKYSNDGTGKLPGDYVCYAILEPGYTWADGSTDPIKIEWSISQATLNTTHVVLSDTSYSYTGKSIKPTVTVTFSGVKLIEGTDYRLAYTNTIGTGTAKVTVTGIGNYKGAVSKSYTINQVSLGKDDVAISYTTVMYTGKALKPAVTVKHGGITLVSGTDYTVAYKNNTKAGTATVAVTGKGGYKGSVSKTFTILSKFSGWKKISGKWYYATSGVLASGWKKIGSSWCYFNPTSKVMATGVVKVSGKYYYLDSSGARKTGWIKSGGYWYYFGGTNGAACIGWKKVGSAWYYFKSDGKMVTGTVTIDGKKYRFSSSGAWLG